MPKSRQRTVLKLGSAAILVAFVLQPHRSSTGVFVGYQPFYWSEAEVGARSVVFLFPHNALLASEFFTITFLTACAYLGSKDST